MRQHLRRSGQCFATMDDRRLTIDALFSRPTRPFLRPRLRRHRHRRRHPWLCPRRSRKRPWSSPRRSDTSFVLSQVTSATSFVASHAFSATGAAVSQACPKRPWSFPTRARLRAVSSPRRSRPRPGPVPGPLDDRDDLCLGDRGGVLRLDRSLPCCRDRLRLGLARGLGNLLDGFLHRGLRLGRLGGDLLLGCRCLLLDRRRLRLGLSGRGLLLHGLRDFLLGGNHDRTSRLRLGKNTPRSRYERLGFSRMPDPDPRNRSLYPFPNIPVWRSLPGREGLGG